MLYIIAGLLLLTVYLFLTHNKRTLSDVPGPFAFPVIGSLYLINLSFLAKTAETALAKYGPLTRLNMPQPYVITKDPEVLKQVLGPDYENYDRSPLVKSVFDDIAGGLVLLPNGADWKFSRELFTPAFHQDNLARLRPVVQGKSQQFVQHLDRFAKSGEKIDMQRWLRHLTFDVIGLVCLGVDFKSLGESESPFEQAFSYILKNMQFKLYFTSMPYWKLISEPEYHRHLSILYGAIQEQIEKREREGVDPNEATMVSFMMRNEQARAWPMKVSSRKGSRSCLC
jgi:cytochrome P450